MYLGSNLLNIVEGLELMLVGDYRLLPRFKEVVFLWEEGRVNMLFNCSYGAVWVEGVGDSKPFQPFRIPVTLLSKALSIYGSRGSSEVVADPVEEGGQVFLRFSDDYGWSDIPMTPVLGEELEFLRAPIAEVDIKTGVGLPPEVISEIGVASQFCSVAASDAAVHGIIVSGGKTVATDMYGVYLGTVENTLPCEGRSVRAAACKGLAVVGPGEVLSGLTASGWVWFAGQKAILAAQSVDASQVLQYLIQPFLNERFSLAFTVPADSLGTAVSLLKGFSDVGVGKLVVEGGSILLRVFSESRKAVSERSIHGDPREQGPSVSVNLSVLNKVLETLGSKGEISVYSSESAVKIETASGVFICYQVVGF